MRTYIVYFVIVREHCSILLSHQGSITPREIKINSLHARETTNKYTQN